jgi:hypothetical protein
MIYFSTNLASAEPHALLPPDEIRKEICRDPARIRLQPNALSGNLEAHFSVHTRIHGDHWTSLERDHLPPSRESIRPDHAVGGDGLPVFSIDDVNGSPIFILARKAAR